MAGPVSRATCPPLRTKALPGHSAHLKTELRRQNEGRLCESLSRVRLSATPWTIARLSAGILQATMLEWAAISLSTVKDVEFIIRPLYRQAPSSHGLKEPTPSRKRPPQKTPAEGREPGVKGSTSTILSCVTESKQPGDKGNTWIWTEGSGHCSWPPSPLPGLPGREAAFPVGLSFGSHKRGDGREAAQMATPGCSTSL